jgi:hypothetical protein
MTFPYLFRWNQPPGRKGEPCRVVARSNPPRAPMVPRMAFGRLGSLSVRNSIMLEFADGARIVTSGNSIRRAR